jgi:hypothetical protein
MIEIFIKICEFAVKTTHAFALAIEIDFLLLKLKLRTLATLLG